MLFANEHFQSAQEIGYMMKKYRKSPQTNWHIVTKLEFQSRAQILIMNHCMKWMTYEKWLKNKKNKDSGSAFYKSDGFI